MWWRDKICFARIVLVCLTLAGCQDAAGPRHCDLGYVTDLPLELHERGFYTTIAINGQQAKLLFDTGSNDNLLIESAAKRLGLRATRSAIDTVEGIGGSREVGAVRSRDVQIGAAHGQNLVFSTVPDAALPDTADGILGMNFLYPFDLDLDFGSGRVRIYRALQGCQAPSVAMTGPLYAVPIAHEPGATMSPVDLSPAIQVTINGKRLRAVIDSGASSSIVFRDSARRAGLGEAALLAQSTIRGVGRHGVHTEIRLSAPVSIGDLTVHNMPLAVADQRHSEGIDMLLGFDFITHVHVWISHSSDTVVLQYPPQASPDLPAK